MHQGRKCSSSFWEVIRILTKPAKIVQKLYSRTIYYKGVDYFQKTHFLQEKSSRTKKNSKIVKFQYKKMQKQLHKWRGKC